MTTPAADPWKTGPGAFWAEHDDRYEALLEPFTELLLDAAGIGPGDRVLDVGCGCGETTRQAARRASGAATDGAAADGAAADAAAADAAATDAAATDAAATDGAAAGLGAGGRGGEAVGLDLSAAMIERARQRAAAEGPANVRFEIGDAQRADLGTGFDAVISRFGVMFFDDAAAAFGALAAALRPGGRLAFVSWRERERNASRTVPADALAPWVPPKPVAPPGAPGAFSLADRDRVRSLLIGAGLVDVRFEALAEPLRIGRDAGDATAFLLAELRADRGIPAPAAASAALRAALTAHQTPAGVLLSSSAWLVTAHRPSRS